MGPYDFSSYGKTGVNPATSLMNAQYPAAGSQQLSSGTAQAAGAMQTAGAGAMAIPTPWTQGAGMALQVAGMGLSAWDKYEQGKRADKNYEQSLKEYEESKRRMRNLDDQREEQLELSNLMAFGTYGQQMEEKAAHTQGQYNAMIGR